MQTSKIKNIGIIALAGACELDKIKSAKLNLEKLGYNVKCSKNIFDSCRYLAGNDDVKIKELHNFFQDPDIDLILAARGGYGSIRLVTHIDYELIKKNPKPFCGFSDITALLLMIYKKTGIITYHGPMACSDFYVYNNFTIQNFINAINSKELIFYGEKSYNTGMAKGIIWGGNLSTVVSLCGRDFIPNKNFIFFAEDINEPVYKIDKMFQQLFNINKFLNNCKAIILGDFLQIDNNTWLEEYFLELAYRFNIPIVSGFKISHNQDKITLPIGKTAQLDLLKLSIKS